MNEIRHLCTVKTPWDEPLTLGWQEIARLALPSGVIVAGDPFYLLDEDIAPFARQVAPGRYPVRLVLGHFRVPANPDTDRLVEDIRVTLGVLCLAAGVPVRWENALPPDSALTSEARLWQYTEDETWCYVVDSGSGAFLDASALDTLHARYRQELDLPQQLADAISANYRSTYDWADVLVDPASGANLVTYATYSGDGVYASYWGYDAADRPVCLVTDFDALDWDVWQTLGGHWADVLQNIF